MSRVGPCVLRDEYSRVTTLLVSLVSRRPWLAAGLSTHAWTTATSSATVFTSAPCAGQSVSANDGPATRSVPSPRAPGWAQARPVSRYCQPRPDELGFQAARRYRPRIVK